MNVRMFDQHTFDVKVKVTVDKICKREGFYEHAEEIDAMRNEKCHLDIVVAVWDKISANIESLKAKKEEYYKEIKNTLKSARVPNAELVEFMDRLNNAYYVYQVSFPDIHEARKKILSGMIEKAFELRNQLQWLENYEKQISEIIAIKPIMPYPQEQEAMEAMPKRSKG